MQYAVIPSNPRGSRLSKPATSLAGPCSPKRISQNTFPTHQKSNKATWRRPENTFAPRSVRPKHLHHPMLPPSRARRSATSTLPSTMFVKPPFQTKLGVSLLSKVPSCIFSEYAYANLSFWVVFSSVPNRWPLLNQSCSTYSQEDLLHSPSYIQDHFEFAKKCLRFLTKSWGQAFQIFICRLL